MLLKSLPISQESSCVEDFFNKIYLKDTSTQVFSCKIYKNFKNTLSYRTSLETDSGSCRFLACRFIRKKPRQRYFSVNFAKFFRTFFFFGRTPPNDSFLCLSVNFEKFSEHFFYRAPPVSCYFMSKLQNLTKYSRKLLYRCFSRILYKIDK